MKPKTNRSSPVAQRRALMLAPAVLLASASGAWADQTFWTLPGPGSGDWFTSGNWSVDVPGQTWPYLTAVINNGGLASVSSGSANTFDLYLGTTGSGSFVQSGGTVDYKQHLHLGRDEGSTGTYTLNAGTLIASVALQGNNNGFTIIGEGGTGTFIQNGGTHTAKEVYVGYVEDSTGSYELHGGTLDSRGTLVGFRGNATFTHTSGLHTVGTGAYDGGLMVGHLADGTYELSGDGQVVADSLAVGNNSGTGIYRQLSGTTTIMDQFGYVGLGDWFGGHGILDLQGGSLTTRSIYVAADPPRSSQQGGTGLFSQSGGNATAELLDVGAGGTYLYTGGTMSLSSGLNVDGVLDFDGSAVAINVGDGSTVDLSTASILNASAATLTIGSNSITTLPVGFDPDAVFASFSTQGIVRNAGDDLVIPSGMTITLNGTYTDHVRVEGTLQAPNAGQVILSGGVEVRNGGVIDTRNNTGAYTNSVFNIIGDRSGMDSGTVHINNIYVGRTSTGKFVQTGGSITVKQYLTLGEYSGGNGTYELSGGSLTTATTTVGDVGTGSFQQTGGTHTTFGLSIGHGAGGSYELSGNSVLSSQRQPGSVYDSNAYVGFDGPATMTQTGGQFGVQGYLYVGYQAAANATYHLSGGSVSPERLIVGHAGMGTFNQSSGSVSTTYVLTLGTDGNGTYNLSGGSISSGPIRVGERGTGVFNQTGGSVSAMALFVSFENYGFGGGTYNLSNGSAVFATEQIGRVGAGSFKQTGGIHQAGLLHITPTGTYEFSGGDLLVQTQMELDGIFDFKNSTATLTLGNESFNDFSQGQLINSGNAGILAGVDSLIQFPAGFDPNTDLGSFSTQGTYHIAGQSLNIQQGQSIHGAGTIIGNVTNAGQVSPGNSPGTISVQGAYSQTQNGELEMEIAPFDFDRLVVSGNATLDGTLTVIPMPFLSPIVGTQFTIITFAGRTGQFDSVDGYIIDGKYFDAIYGSTSVSLIVRQAVLGDTDIDGDIDLSDLSNLANAYGQSAGADWVNGDFDHDGDVDLNDLSSLASRYGAGEAQAMADFAQLTAVPEPAQVSACLAAMAILSRRRRSRL